MFTASKDKNTGVVYKWIKTLPSGETQSYYVPEKDWKLEKDWTREQIESLFASEAEVKETEITVEKFAEPNLSSESETDF